MVNVNRTKKEILHICENGHWTAESLHKVLRKTYFLLGIGTVYRNLTELVTEGILMKTHGLGDRVIYETNKPPHAHIFCQNTGMIQDIEISLDYLQNISMPDNFCLKEIQVTFAGHFKDTKSAYCKINGKVLR